ncbi:MAG TPA: FHA domain-containing protein [Verrucomicrobiae bacterium]|nr:FHA domain-containing protein [Verrucomicrobiae bacterium]
MSERPQSEAWLETEAGTQIVVGERLTIGRQRGNDHMLASEMMSRRHAVILRQEGQFWLADLGSRNGTYVNGRLLMRPQRLHDGDRVLFGGHTHVFRHRGGKKLDCSEETTGTRGTRPEIDRHACWFLVADIVGYSVLSQQMGAEAVARLVGSWVDECWRVIERHEGIVNKFLGDGFFAYWRHSKRARVGLSNAVHALCTLQCRANPPFRFVVHKGEAVFSGCLSGEELIMSPDTTFVFRMEKLAKTLGVLRLLSAASNTGLGKQLASRPLASRCLPGFKGEFQFFTFG